MGCVMFLYAEKKVERKWYRFWKAPHWKSIDKWSVHEYFDRCEGLPEYYVKLTDRIYTGHDNYALFHALAGVRVYDDFPGMRPLSEPKGMPVDCCREIREAEHFDHADNEFHSWLTHDEMIIFNWWDSYGGKVQEFAGEVFEKLHSRVNYNPHKVRIVFWFRGV